MQWHFETLCCTIEEILCVFVCNTFGATRYCSKSLFRTRTNEFKVWEAFLNVQCTNCQDVSKKQSKIKGKTLFQEHSRDFPSSASRALSYSESDADSTTMEVNAQVVRLSQRNNPKFISGFSFFERYSSTVRLTIGCWYNGDGGGLRKCNWRCWIILSACGERRCRKSKTLEKALSRKIPYCNKQLVRFFKETFPKNEDNEHFMLRHYLVAAPRSKLLKTTTLHTRRI